MSVDKLWLPTSDLDYEIPSKHRAGTLLFFPSTRSGATQARVAVRIDSIDEDGDVEPCVFWLTDNEASNAKLANVDRCRDFHLNAERIFGTSHPKIQLSVELDVSAKSEPGNHIAWGKSRGYFAAGSFGYRIIGMAEDGHRNQVPSPIDLATWIADRKLISSRVQPKLWYPAWRICVRRQGGELLRSFEACVSADR